MLHAACLFKATHVLTMSHPKPVGEQAISWRFCTGKVDRLDPNLDISMDMAAT